ncbi:hypothetical protein C8R47DRAFT_1209829 [Mycena vitilis]|nr:hypothetical protein C8R47DRAFT_1209829 [Mycena vitilis]
MSIPRLAVPTPFFASQNGRQGNGNGYNRDEDADPIRVGDLVIVEADRGKDLGKVVNDSKVERIIIDGVVDADAWYSRLCNCGTTGTPAA